MRFIDALLPDWMFSYQKEVQKAEVEILHN